MSKTQARVEGINQQIVRCDIRIPVDIYSRIETIAVEEGMKPHHITGRPMVSPVILELLEVGLRHYKSENQKLSDTVPDRVPDTNLNLDSLKAELLEQLRGELEAIAEKKLTTLTSELEAVSGELATATADRRLAEERLEVGRLRAEELIKQVEVKEQAITTLQAEIERKDGAIQNLVALNQESPVNSQQSEELEKLRNENRSLKNLNIDLENHINAIQDKLSHLELEGINKHPIMDTINRWKLMLKDTQNWTKANQLISEIEDLISPPTLEPSPILTSEPNPSPEQTPTTPKISFNKLEKGDILVSKIDGKKYKLKEFHRAYNENQASDTWIAWIIPKDGKIKPRGKTHQIYRGDNFLEDMEIVTNNN